MKRIILLILDGWGWAPAWGGNAISLARTPNYDKLLKTYPHTTLGASGQSVGLPGHEMGNSEVGHLNIGAGRVVHQDSSRITQAIKNGSFFKNEGFLKAIAHAVQRKGNLHLMGLVSDGGVHSHLDHLFALLELCQKEHFQKVFIHVFTDGRDTEPMGALQYVSRLEDELKKLNLGCIASIVGRYYAMDRDNRWERTALAYRLLVDGEGEQARSPFSAISHAYSQGLSDEFIKPIVMVDKEGKPVGEVQSDDSVIFFNFRSDRARQLSRAFMAPNFDGFPRGRPIEHLFFIGMIPYGFEYELKLPKVVTAFLPEPIDQPLAEVLCQLRLRQFHLAETEKYAHVTYFFNGGREEPFSGEERVLIPSPKVSSYDQQPEMAAPQVVSQLLKAMKTKDYGLVVTNFANPDMVGHTGNLKAAITAVEAVDSCLGQVVGEFKAEEEILIVTADHGNIEQMVNPRTGQMDTEHSINPVPFILVSSQAKTKFRPNGVLADIAPTILNLSDISQPAQMSGRSLF